MEILQEEEIKEVSFTGYEVFVIAILAILQFTIVLDFMVLSPLGALMLEQLDLEPSQFGFVVSAYAISAGISGLLAAGFADKYDRKKLLLFFYSGFILGTFLCALANSYEFLIAARIVAGLFGGVMSSISFAIVIDLFKMEVRGRVMGFVQMAFAASQVLGIPIGLMLANKYGWQSPFWMISCFSILVAVIVFLYLKPITAHLKVKKKENPFRHLVHTVSQNDYLLAFAATTLLATGGYMIMPFGSAFSTYNLGISQEDLPLLYWVTGLFTIGFGPLIGKLSDRVGKYQMFVFGSLLTMVTIGVYTHFGPTPFWIVVFMSALIFLGVSARIISSSALLTGIPKPQDRGAFMSVNSSVQQFSGGIGSAVAGLIVIQAPSGKLLNYHVLGYVVIGATLIVIGMMYLVHKKVKEKTGNG